MNSDDFSQLVACHYESLYRFALSLTHAEADACDLVQQTFYVWAAKGSQLQDRSKAKAWLFTTLHRAFLAGRRKHARHPHCGIEEVAGIDLPSDDSDVADRLDSSHVVSALGKMDTVYRAALALFYLEDCSYDEIARILGIPMGTVKSRIARGLMKLRKLLEVAEMESVAADGRRL